MKHRLDIMKIFELIKDNNNYKMVLCDALPDGDLEMEIDDKEFDRLYNKYNYFLTEDNENRKVFAEDFTDKSNALFYFRRAFAEEFAPYFA